MPTRKIGDLPKLPDGRHKPPEKPCFHPEHNPPSMKVYQPGVYEHECPACGRKLTFTVPCVYFAVHESSHFYSEPERPVYFRQR